MPVIVESGWVGRVRNLADGRRQIVSLVLPGELLIPLDPAMNPSSEAICLGPGVCKPVLPRHISSELMDSFRACERRWLDNQVVRLGRMNAREKLSHLILEVRSRLAGSSGKWPSKFPFPLTQEHLADLLGLRQ